MSILPPMGHAEKFRHYLRRAADYAAYAHRPILWPALARNVVNKLSGKIPDKREQDRRKAEAVAWCAPRAVGADQALRALGLTAPVRRIEDEHRNALRAARERTAAVPVKMGGGGAMDFLYTLCESLPARRVVETGVAYGWSSLAILLSLQSRPGARLYSVDLPYFERHNDQWVGAAVPEDLHARWSLYRMADRQGLPRALRHAGGPIDLAHYDSDKSPEGRDFALPRLWTALRDGGILVCDDIQDNLAFARFCEHIGHTPIILHKQDNDYVGIVKK